ncbi:MAG: DUF4326 domain-containing protein [Oscillospiraceae bacterium]|jgi:hypothetical protein|nr:DUF4326 domain-containing protein [Oscillospiraceae bacterium]
MKPVRIEMKRIKGFNLQQESKKINGLEAVFCARPSKYGNIFKIVKVNERDEGYFVINIYNNLKIFHSFIRELEILKSLELYEDYIKRYPENLERVKKLKNRNLACYCKLSEKCHCDILLKISNE